jgi:hypothetical protein
MKVFAILLTIGSAAAAPANPCGVTLVKQTSHGACVFGSTFGCDDANTMFVKNCSGMVSEV